MLWKLLKNVSIVLVVQSWTKYGIKKITYFHLLFYLLCRVNVLYLILFCLSSLYLIAICWCFYNDYSITHPFFPDALFHNAQSKQNIIFSKKHNNFLLTIIKSRLFLILKIITYLNLNPKVILFVLFFLLFKKPTPTLRSLVSQTVSQTCDTPLPTHCNGWMKN